MTTPRLDPLARLEDDPQGGSVHHPYTAFNQGWDARDEGHAIDLNPYETGTREAHWWSLGWWECDQDDDDDDGDAKRLAVAWLLLRAVQGARFRRTGRRR